MFTPLVGGVNFYAAMQREYTRAVSQWRQARMRRSLLIFSAIVLVLLAAVKGISLISDAQSLRSEVSGQTNAALSALAQGKQELLSGDFLNAETSFGAAGSAFTTLRNTLRGYAFVLTVLSGVLPRQGAEVAAAYDIARAGASLSYALSQVSKLSEDTPSGGGAGQDGTQLDSIDVSSGLEKVAHIGVAVLPKLKDADRALREINPWVVPPEYRSQFDALRAHLPVAISLLEQLERSRDLTLALAGAQGIKRYLFIFQNSNELRPTGGFLGSLALVDIQGGKISNIEIPQGGTYDVSGQLALSLRAPKALQRVNPYWNIQDANWFPDFPTSARKIMWFYERAGGRTVDGVVAVNAQVIESLLRATGPLTLEEYGVTLDADNVLSTLETVIEHGDDKALNIPKRILAELFPKLLERALESPESQGVRFLEVLFSGLETKDIIPYFSDARAQALVTAGGWSGAIAPPAEALGVGGSRINDSLYLVNANIGGGKTDGVIEELVDQTASLESDGRVRETVTLHRTHRGSSDDLLRGSENVEYIRFYVPQGSQFIAADGFTPLSEDEFMQPDAGAPEDGDLAAVERDPFVDEHSGTRITDEFGYSVFGNWMRVGPGESVTARIQYYLPGTLKMPRPFTLFGIPFGPEGASYKMSIKSQPGARNIFYASHLALPSGTKVDLASSGVEVQCVSKSKNLGCGAGMQGALERDTAWVLHWR